MVRVALCRSYAVKPVAGDGCVLERPVSQALQHHDLPAHPGGGLGQRHAAAARHWAAQSLSGFPMVSNGFHCFELILSLDTKDFHRILNGFGLSNVHELQLEL